MNKQYLPFRTVLWEKLKERDPSTIGVICGTLWYFITMYLWIDYAMTFKSAPDRFFGISMVALFNGCFAVGIGGAIFEIMNWYHKNNKIIIQKIEIESEKKEKEFKSWYKKAQEEYDLPSLPEDFKLSN